MEDDLACHLPTGPFGLVDLLTNQLAQVRLELLLELVGRLERVKRRLERAVVVEEPAPDEAVERLELLQPPLPLGLVVQRKRRVAGPAVYDEVGSPARSMRLGCSLQLVHRSRLVAPAVWPRFIERKWSADAGPENADDDVHPRRLRELRLESIRSPRGLVFPEEGLEHGVVHELLLQPRDDVGRAVALDRHISGRGDKDPQRQAGRSVHRPHSRCGSSQARGEKGRACNARVMHLRAGDDRLQVSRNKKRVGKQSMPGARNGPSLTAHRFSFCSCQCWLLPPPSSRDLSQTHPAKLRYLLHPGPPVWHGLSFQRRTDSFRSRHDVVPSSGSLAWPRPSLAECRRFDVRTEKHRCAYSARLQL